MKNKQERKQKYNFRQLLTWMAVFLILLVGYMSVNLIKPLLPDYRNEVVTYEKTERNSPIYLQSDDSIAIYPWDEYDEKTLITLTEYENLKSQSVHIESDQVNEQRASEIFMEISDFLAPWIVMKGSDITDLEEAVTCDISKGTVQYYLKDYPVNSQNAEYLVSLFSDVEYGGFSYHYRRTDAQADSEVINAAHQDLQAAIAEIEGLCQSWFSEEDQITIAESQIRAFIEENPIGRAWYRLAETEQNMDLNIAENYLMDIAYIFYQSGQAGGNYDIVVYQGELLAVFADDEGRRLVIFYDPIQEEVTGISVKTAS